jgi:hypothetical protein
MTRRTRHRRALTPAGAAWHAASRVVSKRFAEPRTVPAAVMKILRAWWRGELGDALLRRGGLRPQDAFYPAWYARYAELTERDREALRAAIARLSPAPKFQVVVRTHSAR